MTFKSTHSGVAGRGFHACMTSATKDENENRARGYTPALLRQKDVRLRPQSKFNSRCIAFQIASYPKKEMFGCESRELAGSDSSQESSDIKNRLISSIDC